MFLKPGEEVPIIKAFDGLFDTIEASEDENGNVVLCSAQHAPTDAGKGHLNVSQVERAIDGIRASARAGLARTGIEIVVVADASTFGPAGARKPFAGACYPKTNRIVLVADALQSAAARKTLTHGHFGQVGLNLLPPEVRQAAIAQVAMSGFASPCPTCRAVYKPRNATR